MAAREHAAILLQKTGFHSAAFGIDCAKFVQGMRSFGQAVRCRDAPRRAYFAMSPDIDQRFREQWPAIQAEWLRLLGEEPLMSPLGRPSTAVYLMEATLLQMQWALAPGREPDWLEKCLPVVGFVHRHCACGLRPVTKYFSTGDQALKIAGEAFPGDLPAIQTVFRAIAARELQSLCAACEHPEWSGCELRQKPSFPQIPP